MGKFNEKSFRINKIREYFCDGNNKIFAEKLGISTTQASNLCGGKINIGEKSLYKVLLAFPEVSKAWLFRGEGEMLSKQPTPTESWFEKRYMNEPVAVPIGMYEAVIRENERLKMENERLREKLRLLSGETAEERILPSSAI